MEIIDFFSSYLPNGRLPSLSPLLSQSSTFRHNTPAVQDRSCIVPDDPARTGVSLLHGSGSKGAGERRGGEGGWESKSGRLPRGSSPRTHTHRHTLSHARCDELWEKRDGDDGSPTRQALPCTPPPLPRARDPRREPAHCLCLTHFLSFYLSFCLSVSFSLPSRSYRQRSMSNPPGHRPDGRDRGFSYLDEGKDKRSFEQRLCPGATYYIYCTIQIQTYTHKTQ